MKQELLLIRVNCPDAATADAISGALIAAKLAPRANAHYVQWVMDNTTLPG